MLSKHILYILYFFRGGVSSFIFVSSGNMSWGSGQSTQFPDHKTTSCGSFFFPTKQRPFSVTPKGSKDVFVFLVNWNPPIYNWALKNSSCGRVICAENSSSQLLNGHFWVVFVGVHCLDLLILLSKWVGF